MRNKVKTLKIKGWVEVDAETLDNFDGILEWAGKYYRRG